VSTLSKIRSFFILGLPRSRTTWLTAYMSDSQVFCCQETFSFPDHEYDGEDFWKIHGYLYRGSVDNEPVNATPYMRDLEAPLVVIDRSPPEVYKSLLNIFDSHPKVLKELVQKSSEALEEAKLFADLIVPYNKIDTHLEDICDLCIPSVGYNEAKHMMFKQMNIQHGGLSEANFSRRYL